MQKQFQRVFLRLSEPRSANQVEKEESLNFPSKHGNQISSSEIISVSQLAQNLHEIIDTSLPMAIF